MKIPLLRDHHSHVSIYSACWRNISHIKSYHEALDYLYSLPNTISVVLGWNSYLYSFEKEDLKNLPPVVVSSTSLHGFVISDRGFELLDDDYRKFISQCQDHSWLEKHMPQLCQLYGSIQGVEEEDVGRFFKARENEGIYYLEDMLLANEKSLNTIANSSFALRTKFWIDLIGYRKLSVDAQKKIYGIKVFSDGALSSKTAAVYNRFIEGDNGILVYSDEELDGLLIEVYHLKKPIAIHAIGDRAIDQVVNAVARLWDNSIIFPEVRIEHAQLISLEMAIKAKKLGIKLCMQPNFSEDSLFYKDRLCQEYCQGNNPFRMLIDDVGYVAGEDLIFGSDGMPHGIQNALRNSIFPPFSEQKLSLEEFVAGYCMKDFSHGFIDVDIDEKNRKITVNDCEICK